MHTHTKKITGKNFHPASIEGVNRMDKQALQLKDNRKQLMSSKININDDKTLEREADIMGSKALQMKPAQLMGFLNRKTDQVIIQRVKGDAGDPHKVSEAKYHELKQGATDQHIITPGVSGCAAIKINVYARGEEGRVLVRSIVFHSDGKDESVVKAVEIANLITGLHYPDKSVTVLVLTNGKHKSYAEHSAKIINPFTQVLEKQAIQCSINHFELLHDVGQTINIDLTGTDNEITERYRHHIAGEDERDERVQQFQRYQGLLERRATTGRAAKRVQQGRARKVNPDYIEVLPIDEFRELRPDRRRQEADKLETALRKPKKSGGCYITTACVEYMKLDDDCEMLTVLRKFRDTFLLNKPNGDELIELYYEHSPLIVSEIKKRKNSGQIFSSLYGVIEQCVEAIKNGNSEFAFNTYCRMVNKLRKEFIPHVSAEFTV